MRSDRKAKTPDPARGLVLDRSVPAELVVHAGPEDVVIAANFPRSEDRREWQDTGKGPRGAEVDIEKLPPAHSVPAPTVRPPRQSLWVKAVSGLAATHSEESIFAQVKGQFGRRCLGPLSARPPPSKTPGEKPGAFAFVRKLVLTDQYQPPSL